MSQNQLRTEENEIRFGEGEKQKKKRKKKKKATFQVCFYLCGVLKGGCPQVKSKRQKGKRKEKGKKGFHETDDSNGECDFLYALRLQILFSACQCHPKTPAENNLSAPPKDAVVPCGKEMWEIWYRIRAGASPREKIEK
jgi:hypothetical protein